MADKTIFEKQTPGKYIAYTVDRIYLVKKINANWWVYIGFDKTTLQKVQKAKYARTLGQVKLELADWSL